MAILSRIINKSASSTANRKGKLMILMISIRYPILNPDDTLLGVIKSRICCAEEEFDDLEVAALEIVELGNMGLEIPEFPFEIEDNAKEGYITLTRKYQDEEIKVTVKDRNC
ncbi:hypothetical protein C5167_000701 [Papaver somniferum]|uniref:Uncharacterized protein n=1 Tax=Papaver somniferum TaxID=3469 RepID=A0A4Y7KV43_PAPSO|nr:hypothetical protein C5167_000701 [Papaver somniferum]